MLYAQLLFKYQSDIIKGVVYHFLVINSTRNTIENTMYELC